MKEQQGVFEKFYKRIRKEAIIKSLLIALIVSLVVYCALVMVSWLTHQNWLFWTAIGIFAACFAGLTVLCYLKMRPTRKELARRIDSQLGLEERAVTMTELEGDDSFMAQCQREDAKLYLEQSSPKRLAVAVPVIATVLAMIMIPGGVAVTTVTGLAMSGKIDDPGSTIIGIVERPEPEVFYNVVYRSYGVDAIGDVSASLGEGMMLAILTGEDEGGLIDGEPDQYIIEGGNAAPVNAICTDDDYAFLGWYCGNFLNLGGEDVEVSNIAFLNSAYLDTQTGPYRQDLEIYPNGENATVDEEGNITITYNALFLRLSEDEGSEGGWGDEEEDEEVPSDAPDEGEESDPQPKPGDSENNGKPGEGDGAGSGNGMNNTVVDGNQQYDERVDEFYQRYLDLLASGQEIPEYLKKIIETSYGIDVD